MKDPIETLREIKAAEKDASEGEPKKACMFYLPVRLEAEFRTFVGNGNASKILDGLIREFLHTADKKGLLNAADKKRMKEVADKAARKHRSGP